MEEDKEEDKKVELDSDIWKKYEKKEAKNYKKIFKFMQVYYIKKTFKEFSIKENNQNL